MIFQIKDAEFIGWQYTPRGENFALYNIIDRTHPSYGSTVTEETLRRLKLQVPQTPMKSPSSSDFNLRLK
jgi:hypothetical protein